MILRRVQSLLGAALVLPLAGCIGFHSLPPPDYAAQADDGVLRVVFDERGDPWPVSADAAVAAVLPGDLDKSRTFRLAGKLDARGAAYDRAAVLDAAAAKLTSGGTGREGPGGRGRVVVLIRGFNNSYESFHAKYAQMRQWLGAQGAAADVRYVEVYWDALHRAGGRVAYPVALFTRSRGNAERAGACGLRDLLRRLPPGTDVTLLAHSLGAVVAMGAMADVPPGRTAPVCDGKPAPHPVPAQLGDVRIAAFAPAVGAGLLEDDKGQVPPALLSHIARFYVAFNPNDPAVTKRKLGLNLPDTLGGDTRLGGNPDFVAQVDDRLAAAGLADGFQTLRFEHKAHELPTYLADTARAQCLLWAAKVLPDAPPDCGLTR
jgi:hypothetical protein